LQTLVSALLDALDEDGLRELASRLRPYLHADDGQLLAAADAAARLGLHPETLSRMARSGRVHAIKVGREWRFDPARLAVSPLPVCRVSMPDAPPRRPPARAAPASVAAIRGRR